MSAALILGLVSLTTCLQDQLATPAPAHAPPPADQTATPAPAYAPPPADQLATPAPVYAPPPADQLVAPRSTPADPPHAPQLATDVVPPPPARPTPQPYGPPPPPPPTTDPPAQRSPFVFAAMPALTFNLVEEGLPSLSGALFFGRRLRDPRWALGYQVTGAVGPGEAYRLAHLGHRHSLVVMSAFGSRGFASMGLGLAFILVYPVAVETEARIGWRLGKRKRGLFGGQLRLGHDVLFGADAFMRPQIGLFFGFSLL